MVGTGRKNNVCDTMTVGDERTAVDIDPDAVDRPQEIVASLADESLQWLSADIDEIENRLPEADKKTAARGSIESESPRYPGARRNLRFPFDPASGRRSSSRDGLTRRAAEPRGRGSDAWIFCRDADVLERWASGDGDATSRQAVDDAILKVEIRYDGP